MAAARPCRRRLASGRPLSNRYHQPLAVRRQPRPRRRAAHRAAAAGPPARGADGHPGPDERRLRLTMADERSLAHGELWRAFPWDREAPEGGPFSVRSVAPPQMQNYGRFDLHGRPSVLYLAQTPAHALAEVLRGLKRNPADPQRYRVSREDLIAAGNPRALVSVRLPPE